MEEVGLFEAVVPLIDVDAADSYHVAMLVREPRPFRAGVSMSVDNNAESHATLNTDAISCWGTGERLSMQVRIACVNCFLSTYSLQATRGHRGTALFNVSAVKPLLGWQRYRRTMLTAYRSLNHYHVSCYDALQSGVQLQMSRVHPRWHVDESLTFNS